MSSVLDSKITKITPVYEYEDVAGGYFEVCFDFDETSIFKLSFAVFLDYRVRQDDELFNYLKKTAYDKTCSFAIYDLYDIGFPVDEWVVDYFEMAKSSISVELFNAMMQFYHYMKTFKSNSSGSLD